MTFKLTKDYVCWNLNPGVHLFYLWWGINPLWGFHGQEKYRVFEFGVGTRSWELFRIK